ncbi:cysteine desulfurase DndA [Vibrio cyclitrophicus]|uniref:cysteine desulfurase DndA n=1 Tax=Vibrio cyclitrophicus TaxID=47951 RepID=UPI000C866654|nr:cysteine desulfurase DndA [Vibrio cyclitrophicus]MCC4775878.1 cysteine desulfurase DndA [Vibrio cyclitrophicus]MCC4843691.1 cysteine desulfurase DndA [Vibrio cyclitrophicus]PME08835.1 cysteine desulfurase DndA [Vibrio cyclitrophicus]PME58327.1 cysteine desulfurase DndA [Vibrio cyclitrophicus]PME80118.1 cysteine desulfurase DndA [Vibrio cyclitrophicus]
MTTYLDCNATTPMAPEVAKIVSKYMFEEYGNAGSRTHEFGVRAKQATELARKQVADVVGAEKNEVVFTSGATESNNIAILGLKSWANSQDKKHIITTKIEHKAVLEPIEALEAEGFEVTYLGCDESGLISKESLADALRDDTCLVSIMHVNNETGSIQDIPGYCDVLENHTAYFHVDAAQGFGKYSESLNHSRVDMISVSGHKLYGPKGIGALIVKRRGYKKVPLKPLMFGGGQERGLRPGTLPVALIAGLGEACSISNRHSEAWSKHCQKLKDEVLSSLSEIGIKVNGYNTAPHVLNFSIPEVNSEAAMVALKGIAAVSNGSACTSSSYTPSHVLTAMGLDEERIDNAIRMSWCYQTKELPLGAIVEKIKQYL